MPCVPSWNIPCGRASVQAGSGGTGQGVWLPEWQAVASLSVGVPGKQVFGEAQIVIIHIVWNGGGRGREKGR